jgi:iron(III) transport system ATP-binding protein
LHCQNAQLRPGAETAVSIRSHDLKLSASSLQGENVLSGTVTREVYLGGSRDYVIELKDGTQIRAVTAASDSLPKGSAVFVQMPPGRCRALLK